jgi:hypothetical protein
VYISPVVEKFRVRHAGFFGDTVDDFDHEFFGRQTRAE